MKRVIGLGGIFFKARDRDAMRAWYRDHLGIDTGPAGFTQFEWRAMEAPEKVGQTVWSLFPADTRYLDPGTANFMINYRVENLDALLEMLHAEGVEVDPKKEDSEFGKFGWIIDPEGNKIELWEPPASTDSGDGIPMA